MDFDSFLVGRSSQSPVPQPASSGPTKSTRAEHRSAPPSAPKASKYLSAHLLKHGQENVDESHFPLVRRGLRAKGPISKSQVPQSLTAQLKRLKNERKEQQKLIKKYKKYEGVDSNTHRLSYVVIGLKRQLAESEQAISYTERKIKRLNQLKKNLKSIEKDPRHLRRAKSAPYREAFDIQLQDAKQAITRFVLEASGIPEDPRGAVNTRREERLRRSRESPTLDSVQMIKKQIDAINTVLKGKTSRLERQYLKAEKSRMQTLISEYAPLETRWKSMFSKIFKPKI